MKEKHFISRGCMKLIADWIHDYQIGSPRDPRHEAFLKGLYIIIDDEIRESVSRERARLLTELNDSARN